MRARLDRLRWLLVPLAAYLLITLVLPAANGAVRRPDFWRHAGYVVGGCLVVISFALLVDLVRRRKS